VPYDSVNGEFTFTFASPIPLSAGAYGLYVEHNGYVMPFASTDSAPLPSESLMFHVDGLWVNAMGSSVFFRAEFGGSTTPALGMKDLNLVEGDRIYLMYFA
jgi:hypothetical protein